ncbi:hypothetical protein F5X98DRAFT_378258 [Xylaria grammica]|nr:hypothetical protein F5X98DRAFT_378258 [Xylaria grammica]
MQFLKPLLLASLLSVQALGIAVPIVARRDNIATIPTPNITVDIAEAKREQPGCTLVTNGLKTCITMIVWDRAPRETKQFDKILALVSLKFCGNDEGPVINGKTT